MVTLRRSGSPRNTHVHRSTVLVSPSTAPRPALIVRGVRHRHETVSLASDFRDQVCEDAVTTETMNDSNVMVRTRTRIEPHARNLMVSLVRLASTAMASSGKRCALQSADLDFGSGEPARARYMPRVTGLATRKGGFSVRRAPAGGERPLGRSVRDDRRAEQRARSTGPGPARCAARRS